MHASATPADPERVIAYAAQWVLEAASELGVAERIRFESYRLDKEKSRQRLAEASKVALKTTGFSGTEIAGIRAGNGLSALRRTLGVISALGSGIPLLSVPIESAYNQDQQELGLPSFPTPSSHGDFRSFKQVARWSVAGERPVSLLRGPGARTRSIAR